MVTCEPALAAAGAQFGFRAAALSDEAKLARATFATMLHLGGNVEPRVVGQIAQTLETALRFMQARPWQIVRPEVPIELTIALGGRERRLVASVLGADGVEHGIALHESAEALARFVELAEPGSPTRCRPLTEYRSSSSGSERCSRSPRRHVGGAQHAGGGDVCGLQAEPRPPDGGRHRRDRGRWPVSRDRAHRRS